MVYDQRSTRRILFLITTADWGGAQHFIHQMALECRSQGHQVMIAFGGEGELERRAQHDGIQTHRLQTVIREISPIHDLAAIHEIRTVIRAFKPDVVHLNSSKMSVLGAIAADRERVLRVLYRIGGWSFLEDIGRLKQKLYIAAERWSASKKDVIVTVHPGDESVARTLKIRPRGFTITIPNGINLHDFDTRLLSRDESRTRLGLPKDAFIVGTVANFYPPKNIPWYLESIATALHDIPNVHYAILGDGPGNERVKEIHHTLGLQNLVTLAGRRNDASTLYRAFDAFVLPSTKEGMPWALLEAMAAGLPCIATDVGACRWMCEPESGIILQPNDRAGLAEAVASLCNDHARRKTLGEYARRTVEERFRWETTAKKTLELFQG